jgi:hypothetical protein
MRKLTRRSAALAAAVLSLSAAATSSSAATIYTQSNLLDTGNATHFVAMVDPSLHRPPVVVFQWGSFKSGSQTASFDIPDSDTFTSYAVFGLDTSGGVFVSFSTPGFGVGESFDQLFPGVSEQGLVTDLPTDGPTVTKFADLLATMPQASTNLGVVCACTHLSVGADYGTFEASLAPLPEPGSCTLILGTAAYALRRRRRT